MFGLFNQNTRFGNQNVLNDEWKIVTSEDYSRHKREAGFLLLIQSDGNITLDVDENLTGEQKDNLIRIATDIFDHKFP